MKLRTAVVLAFFGLATLACGGGSTSVDYSDFAVPITEPWSSMGLPHDDGAVMMSDETMISVNYDGSSVDGELGDWVSSVEGAGWAKEGEASEMSGIKTQMFKKDGKTLTLTVSDAMGTTVVTATIF